MPNSLSIWFHDKYATIKSRLSSQDTQQSITVITSFAADAFKILMASMLSVFIPQGCPQNGTNNDLFIEYFPDKPVPDYINGTYTETAVCTFKDNFTDLIDYNSFVLAFNFITLCYFIYLYWIELRRERWMISHFDYDKEKPDENILTLKIDYPDIMEKLQKYNYKYMLTYKYLHILYIANFLFSAILVLYFYYLDFRTITALITNTALCTNKIRVGRNVAYTSYHNEHAFSFYNTKNISFNVIDPRFTAKDDPDYIITESGIDKDNRAGESLNRHITGIRNYINTL